MDFEVAGIPLAIIAASVLAGYIAYRVIKSYVIMLALIVVGVVAAGGSLYALVG